MNPNKIAHQETKRSDGREYLYENEVCRKHGLRATCNACDALIFTDEMTPAQFTANGGYCLDCSKHNS